MFHFLNNYLKRTILTPILHSTFFIEKDSSFKKLYYLLFFLSVARKLANFSTAKPR